MAIKSVSNFSGELPAVPVYKDGKSHLCHNQKELDKWTKPENEGGQGYSLDYQHQEYPKLMSHPSKGDAKVANAKEQAQREAEGYNFEHWDNNQAKQAVPTGAAPSFDPKAQARIDALEKQLALIVESLAPKAPKAPKAPRDTE